MDRLYSVLALALLLPGSACAQADVRSLEWLDTASAEHLLDVALRTDHLELLSVCGYACGTPEVGWTQYERCYQRGATVRVIDPTGDVIESDRHAELKQRAFDVAAAYNAALLKVLDSLGKRECPPGEEWDELFLALNRLADSIPQDPYVSSVISLPRRAEAQFQFHAPNEAHLSDVLYRRICELPPRYGIQRRVAISVTSGDVNRDPKQHRTLICRGGRVAG